METTITATAEPMPVTQQKKIGIRICVRKYLVHKSLPSIPVNACIPIYRAIQFQHSHTYSNTTGNLNLIEINYDS